MGGGGHQGHQLVAGVGPPRGVAQVQTPVSQLGQTQTPGRGGGKHQPGVGHQAVIVEGDLDAVGMAAWQHLKGAPSLGSVFRSKPLSQIHGSTFLPPQTSSTPIPSVDSGLAYDPAPYRNRPAVADGNDVLPPQVGTWTRRCPRRLVLASCFTSEGFRTWPFLARCGLG